MAQDEEQVEENAEVETAVEESELHPDYQEMLDQAASEGFGG
jgi:hypothetical protein